MVNVVKFLEDVVHYAAEIGIHLVELAGILVLLITAVQGIIGYFKNDPHIRLKLAQGIALALEFKLGGEVLRTVLARDWNELAILGAVIALRAALTVLLHWEIKNEEQYVEGSIHEIRRRD
ncbi:MAG: DUF1622 domain-containing protein [Clostridia bacterium]|nr:DUF1622 domain-containing protein [Clostridia bacterium]